MNTEPTPPVPVSTPKSLGDRIGVRLATLTSLVTLVGSIAAAVLFFNPIPERDVTVWVRQQVPITLPIGAPLTMTYERAPVRSATLLQVRLANFGSKPVGDTGPWQLTLASKDGAQIVLVSAPQLEPPNLTFRSLPVDPAKPAALHLELGLLKPAEFADLRLLAIDPKSVDDVELTGECTRAANVPTPRFSHMAPESEVRYHYEDPLFGFFFLLLVFLFLVMAIRSPDWRPKLLWGSWGSPLANAVQYVIQAFGFIFGLGIVAAAAAKAVSWAATQLVLYHFHHPSA